LIYCIFRYSAKYSGAEYKTIPLKNRRAVAQRKYPWEHSKTVGHAKSNFEVTETSLSEEN